MTENEYSGSPPDVDTEGFDDSYDDYEAAGELEPSEEAPEGPPETPGDFGLTLPDDFPAGAAHATLMQNFQGWARELGLTPNQTRGLFERYLTLNKAALAQSEAAHDQARIEAEGKLKAEWGSAYQTNLDLANRVIRDFADEGIRESLAQGSAIWNDPAFARLLHRVGLALQNQGGGGPSTGSTGTGGGKSPTVMDNIDARLAEIAQDPALMDYRHPGHQKIVAERDRLMKLKYDR
jgi:hypothetical protein